MENCYSTPYSKPLYFSQSEPGKPRTPLSTLKALTKIPATPVSKPSLTDTSTFELEMLKNSSSTAKYCKLPLPLLVKPGISAKSKDLSHILINLRSKKVKSILKPQAQGLSKTVHFSDSVKPSEHLSEIKTQSITTTSNSVAESRYEANEEEKGEFKYEEEIRGSILVQDYDEYPTVSFCRNCSREIVTVVNLEKIRPGKGLPVFYWAICWCFPACMYPQTELVHRCSICDNEIIRVGN